MLKEADRAVQYLYKKLGGRQRPVKKDSSSWFPELGAPELLATIAAILFFWWRSARGKISQKWSLDKTTGILKMNCPTPGSMLPQYRVNRQGMWLHTRRWIHQHNSTHKAILFLVHGYGEHAGRYEHVASELIAKGFDVYALDHQGHGLSDWLHGQMGNMANLHDLVTDYVEFFDEVMAGYDNAPPVYLLGHSMGGLLAAYIANERHSRFRGVMYSAPFFRGPADLEEMRVSPTKRKVAEFAARLFPSLRLFPLNTSTLSHSESVTHDITRDPLYMKRSVSLGVAAEFLKRTEEGLRLAQSARYPFIILHGDADMLTSHIGSKEFCDSAPSEDKTCKIISGAWHELLNEPTWKENLSVYVDWMEERMTRK